VLQVQCRRWHGEIETGQGVITSSHARVGGDMICATGAEGQPMKLDCASIGAEGVITEISFASFGLPRGQCGKFSHNEECSAVGVSEYVQSACVGKSSCSFMATHTQLGVEKACSNFSRMYVQAKCSKPMAAGYSLKVTIPVGASASIFFPKLEFANPTIVEGGKTIWQNGAYQAGDAGISAMAASGSDVMATVGSGVYSFAVTGTQGDLVCGSTVEGANAYTISCAAGKTITNVRFAAFGTPAGVCGSYAPGWCNAGSALTVVKNACLFKNSCSIVPSPNTFGDPCFSTYKIFAAEVICT